ncbi:uncharacterized protein si:ch211-250c4.3 isoform X1 [Hemiscyllium ocellatum]|uniref:uncharacterized protein si:ch211-250c4.3 isoform X1 n=2 Tax=Hemiscyllium ocellatum TaxID=170820 RepID=UPI0029668C51|nr:uncharacterized protein si:ch211-250c4.3 isoform X1 [Hemiscyllium ocellatum]
MMFGRNGIFGAGGSWKKVVRQDSCKKKVVLTKVTLLQNGSPTEDTLSHPVSGKTGNPEASPAEQPHKHAERVKTGFESSFLEYAAASEPSNCSILKFYKSESEDSGVELPSGTNSPSTPSGSEQSFVVHRRESSCDSGMALSIVSSSPGVQHCPFIADCHNPDQCLKEDTGPREAPVKVKKLPTATANWKKTTKPSRDMTQSPTVINEEVTQPRHVSLVEIVIADTNSTATLNRAEKHATETPLNQEALKRRPSSDSLNDYMEECCRLSQVNQEKVGDRGSGLGYLEHICQLIETIGQLQDQNKQLQKQALITERALKVNRMKEEFFLNHCSCGAVGIYQSLANLPDLQIGSCSSSPSHGISFKGEDTAQITGRTENNSQQAEDTQANGREHSRKYMCRKMLSQQDLVLGHEELSELNSHCQDHQDAEGQSSGKIKLLLRDSKLKTRPVRDSFTMLKQSCPQLYRPEDGRSSPLIKETNSASVWGLNRNSDWEYTP